MISTSASFHRVYVRLDEERKKTKKTENKKEKKKRKKRKVKIEKRKEWRNLAVRLPVILSHEISITNHHYCYDSFYTFLKVLPTKIR